MSAAHRYAWSLEARRPNLHVPRSFTAMPQKGHITRVAMPRTSLSYTCVYTNTAFSYEYDEDFVGYYSFPSHIYLKEPPFLGTCHVPFQLLHIYM